MPADINAYALSLELTLQDNATEALRGIVNIANTIEEKLAKVQERLSKISEVGEVASKKIVSNFTKAVQVLEKMPININKASDAYKQQQDMIDQIGGMSAKIDTKQNDRSVELYAKTEKHRKWVGKDQKRELKFEIVSDKMSKTQLKMMKKVHEVTKQTQKSDKERYTTAEDLLSSNRKSLRNLGLVHKALGLIKSVDNKVHNLFTGMLGTLGMPQLAEFASLTGLLKVALLGAAEAEEKYHTVQFRQLGTMEKLSETTRDLNQVWGFTVEELDNVTIALRNAGMAGKGIDDLRIVTAGLVRTTGASADGFSKMAQILNNITKSSDMSAEMMNRLENSARQFALTGGDIDTVMQQIGQDAIWLGTSGRMHTERWSQEMIKTAAAAKKIGVDVGEAMQSMKHSIQDPINAMKILQKEGYTYNQILMMSPEERVQAVNKMLSKQGEIIKKLEGSSELADHKAADRLRRELKARLGLSEAYGELDKRLGLVAEMTKEGADGITDQQKALEKAAPKGVEAVKAQIPKMVDEAEGQLRRLQLAVDKVIANIINMFSGIREQFYNLLKAFLSNPLGVIFTSWGLVAAAVGASIVGIFGSIITAGVNLVTACLSITAAFRGTAAATNAATAAGAANTVANAGAATGFLNLLRTAVPLPLAFGTIVIAAGAVAAAMYKIASDTTLAYEGIQKLEKTYLDTKKRLDKAGQLVPEDQTIALKIHALQAKASLLGKSDEAEKKRRDIALQITELQQKQVNLTQNNLGLYNDVNKRYDEALKSRKMDVAIQASLEREALKRGMSMQEFVKDQKAANKVIDETKSKVQSFIDEDSRLNKARENSVKQEKISALISEQLHAEAERTHKKYENVVLDQEAIQRATVAANKEFSEQNNIAKNANKALTERRDVIGEVNKGLGKQSDIAKNANKALTEQCDIIGEVNKELDRDKEFNRTAMTPTTVSADTALRNPPVVEPIVTVQVDSGTARSKYGDEHLEHTKQQIAAAREQNILLTKIAANISGESAEKILELLNKYVPDIADAGNPGLAPSANQWV